MKRCYLLLFSLALPFALAAASPDEDIRQVLSTQVAAWNRADIPAFVSSYAEDCTFIGKQISHGRDQVTARYQKNYPTPDAMGKLAFANLIVKPLDGGVAIVTGEFHLDRSAAAGGEAHGLFSLVFQLKSGKWMIVLDHTS